LTLVTKEDNDGDFQALVYETIGSRSKIPVFLTLQDKDKCEEWFIERFVDYFDVPGITLEMKGSFCEGKAIDKQIFSCSETEKGLSCFQRKEKDTKPFDEMQ
jgi:hypothetical protein